MSVNATDSRTSRKKGPGYYLWTLGVIWTLAIGTLLAWNLDSASEQVLDLVRVQARTAYDKDVLYRFWNSSHKFVYVPVSEETPPNPYLDVPERDISTPDGVPLTMMNPAYMTRQANELGLERIGIYGHLTSLKPLRPDNAPDPWEAKALKEFENGVAEISSVEPLAGNQVMRLMRPLLVEQECIECHAHQGYKVGEVRGGISVSIEMTPSLALLASTRLQLVVGYVLLWLTGLSGLIVRARLLVKRDNERQRQEESLQQINSELEERVAERTLELEESKRLLEEDIRQRIAAEEERERLTGQLRQAQKMELVGTLAGGIAHDFNNLLTPILGYSELALQRPEVGEKLQKDLRQIFGAAQRAKGLVKQILAFSRRSEHAKQPVCFRGIIDEVLELVRPTFPKTIRIEEELLDPGCLVNADPGQLHQVVMNLCTNAWQAMAGVDGVLRLKLEQTTLASEAGVPLGVEAGVFLCLQISDTGSGMDEEVLKKLFDPFFTTKQPGEGTGLGLAVVQGIVHSHGGFIDVDSAPGQGSCFKVYLPLCAARTKGQTKAIEVSAQDEQILLVDDEADIVDLLIAGLTGYGYRVVGFTSSRAALRAFEQQPADYALLLTDRCMPGLSGQQLADAVLKLRPELPVLFMTGYDEECGGQSELTACGDPCLPKPLTASEVARKITVLLSSRNAS